VELTRKRPFALAVAAPLAFGASSVAASESGRLRAGAASVDITPAGDPFYPPSGQCAHERLYVRAIVCDSGATRAALIGGDLGGFGEDVWAPVSQQVDAGVYGAIGQRAKKASPLANTVLVTLANGRANSGYIPDDASFGAYTFQVLGSRLKPGCAEQGIADGIADLVGRYAGVSGTSVGSGR
jgi:hypothetical protein